MTDEQKQARAEKARAARAAAAQERSDAIEARADALIKPVWDRIPEDSRRVLTYIREQIASGKRTPSDVAFLRATRRLRVGQFLPRGTELPEEDPDGA